jgi:large repetitive protein
MSLNRYCSVAIATLLLLVNPLYAQKKSHPANKNHSTIAINTHVERLLQTTAGDITYTGAASFCQGGSKLLTAPTGTLFQWIKDGVNISSGGTSATYTATAAGSYSVIVNGDTSNAVVLIVTPNPVADFTFTDNLCSGTAVPFTSTITSGTAPFTYTWDFGDGGNSSAQNPTHAFTSVGCGTKTFNVKLTVTDANGCTYTTAVKLVNIKQAPDVQLTDPDIFTPFSNCDKSPTAANPDFLLTVNNSSPSLSCITKYDLDWGDGTVQLNVSFPTSHTYNQLGTFNLIVTTTANNGCVNSKSYLVANQSNPGAGFGTIPNTTTGLCAPAAVPLLISDWQNNSPGTTYLLNFGDGTSITLTHPLNNNFTTDTITHVYTKSSCPSSTFTATLTVLNACSPTPYSAGNIQVRIKPTAAFTLPQSVCAGTSVCFNNTTVLGNYGPSCSDATSYSWDFGDGGSQNTSTSPCHTYNTPGTYTISLVASNPCGSSTITKQVCVTAAPTSVFTVDKNEGCAPLTVNATNTSNTLTSCAPATYLWTVTYTPSNCGTGSAFTFVSNTTNSSIHPSFQFSNPGTYKITLSVTNICGTVTSNKTIVVKQPPKVVLANIPTTCGINTITPTATITNCGTTPETYLWSFPGGTPSSSTLASPGTITYNGSGTFTITLAVTNECGTTTDTKTVTINPKPDINSPVNQSFCPGASVGPFDIKGGLAGTTYSWTNSNTAIGLAASGNTAIIPTFTVNNTTANAISGIITITATNAGCSNTASFTITVNPKPLKPVVVRPVNYCQSSTAAPLTATASSGNTLTWYDNPQLTNGTTTPPTPSTTTVGSTTYYVSQTNSFSCTSDTSKIGVTIVPAINGNTIAADQTRCSGSTPDPLTGSTPTGGTGSFIYQWQVSTDGGTTWTNITGATGVNYSPGVLTADTKYRRLVTSSTCTSTSNEITITIQGVLNNIGIAASQTICAGTVPALLTGQLPTGGNGTFTYQWQSSTNNSTWNDITGETQQDYQPPALTANTYYRRKVSSGLCNTQSPSVLITVNQRPVINTIADRISCNNTSITGINFTSTPNSNVTYAWTNDNINIGLAASGTGASLSTFTSANNSNPKQPITASITVAPTYTSGGVGCTGIADTFTITILPIIGITQPANEIVCTGSTIASLTPMHDAGTFTGSTVTCSWIVTGAGTSLVSGTGTSIPSYTVTNTGTTDLITNITITPKYSFSGKTCDGTPTSYTVTVKPGAPAANAGPDVKLCAADSYTMQAVISGTATGTWSQVSGSIVTIVNPASATTQVTGLSPDQAYQFVWTVAGFASCPTTTDTIRIINRPAITLATAGADKVICDFVAGGPNNMYTLTGNLDATRNYEKGKWTFVGSSNGATLNYDTLPNAIITFVNAGTYTLVWTITNDAGCPPAKDTVVVNVFAKPVVGSLSVSAPSVCTGQSVTVTATGITGNVLMWQYLLNGNTIWRDTIVTSSSITFNNVTDTMQVRVVVISSGAAVGCSTAVTSNAVTINVAPPTLAGITGPNSTECRGSNTGNITLSGNNGVVVRWESSTDNGATWTPIANTTSTHLFNNLTTTTWFRAVVKSGTCTEAFSTATIITIVAPVTLPNAGTDQSLCNVSTFSLSANAPAANETGVWLQIAGPAVTISSTAATSPAITGVVPGTYQFKWTISNNICPAKSDTVQVIVYPPLVNSIDTSTLTICSGQPITINGSVATGGNNTYAYAWEQSTDGGVTWQLIAGQTSASLTLLPAQNVWVRRLVTSGPCTSTSLVTTINVQPPLNNNVINADQSICINTSASLLVGSVPTGGDGQYSYQWQQSIDGGTTWTSITNATAKDYSAGVLTVTTLYRRIVSTALCNGSHGSVSNIITITVNPDAKAVYTFTTNMGCAPFHLDSVIIKLQRYDDRVVTYNWYANGNFIGSNSFPGYTIVNPEDSVTIKLVAISKYGCQNDSIEYKFYTVIKPSPDFSISDTVACGPLTVSFTNLTPRPQLFTFLWDFGNGITSTVANPGNQTYQTNPTFFDTIYKVKLTTFSVCDTITVTKTIRVKSKPKALFTPDKTIGCSPMLVNFNNTSHGNNISYKWDLGDGTIINSNNPTAIQHTYNTAVQDTFYAKLIATNECGSDTQKYAIVVRPNAIHLDIAVNGNQTSACKPDSILFINNSSGGTSFIWDFGDGNIITTIKNIDSIYHHYTQAGTFTVTVHASNGCSDTTSTEVIRMFAKPVVDFGYMPSPVCIGDSIQFTNQSDTITGLTWKFGDGNSTNIINPKYKYAAAGTFTVTLVGVRQYSVGNACIDSAKKMVTVLSNLPGSFRVSDSVSTCVPFTATFTNQTAAAAIATWDFGDGRRDTGNVVTHTFTSVGTFQVVMTATSSGGCKYTMIKPIVVNGPAGTFTYDHGNICGSLPVRFQVNATGTDSIRYNFGDGSFVTTTNTTVFHSYSQGGNYVPSVTLIAGPTATCRLVLPGIDTIKVDIVKAGFREALAKECGRTIVSFTDTSRAYAGLIQWSWKFGNGNTSTLQNPTQSYTSTNNWQVQLVARSNSGCADTATKTIFVKVNNNPVSFIVSDTVGCVGQPVLYTSSVLSQDTISSYQWTFTNGLVANASSVTNNYAVAGTYNATLISSTIYGCSDTARKSITIHPTPMVRASDDKVICRGTSVQLNATGAPSYSWGPLYGLSCYTCANPIANPTINTAYEVTGSNAFGCSAKDTVNIRVVQPFTIGITGKDTICTGQSTQLIASGATRYVWTPSTGLNFTNIATPVASPTLTTAYRVVGYDTEGCFTDTARITVAVGEYPTVNLGPDKVLSTGTLLPLNSVITNGPIARWIWTPTTDLSCSSCPLPVANIKKEITYRVAATNQYNCTGYDTINIKVFCESTQVFIPNLFTPDNDGVNDILMVRGTGIKTIKSFRIFNRWGELVFERSNFSPNDKTFGWDGTVKGTKAPPDIYVYTCEVLCENDIPFVYKGNTAIIK